MFDKIEIDTNQPGPGSRNILPVLKKGTLAPRFSRFNDNDSLSSCSEVA